MSTSSYDSAFRVGSTQIAITPGITNAVWLGTQQYLLSSELLWVSGGTAAVVGCNVGQTLSAGSLNSAPQYYVPTSIPLKVAGPAEFYLGAYAATAVVQVFWQYSQGASFAV